MTGLEIAALVAAIVGVVGTGVSTYAAVQESESRAAMARSANGRQRLRRRRMLRRLRNDSIAARSHCYWESSKRSSLRAVWTHPVDPRCCK